MENTIFKCLGCGNGLESGKAVDGLVTCDFCGMKRTVPKRETKPAALTYLMLAEHDLEVGEFDKAYTGYRKAAEADGEEPEAYFGMALARFKVQYLKDFTAETVRFQPICHEITEKKFTEDKNYLKALSLSSGNRRAKYEEQAREIDYINREFCTLKAKGAKYDCFLCVKVTNESGGHTEDSHTATTLYHELKKAGYSPFYSEEEVRGRTGADYEALILYALWSSRCMLVICSNEEYLQTPWVKNEYTRFIKMLREEEKEDRSIAIVFGDTPVEKLSGVQGKIQGIPFKSYDALDRIRAFVDRFAVKEAPELARKEYGTVTYQKKSVLKTGVEKRRLTVTGGGEVTVSDKAKLNIAGEFLTRRVFSAAIRFCDQLIKDNPQNGEAYWIRFLAENQCVNTDGFISKQAVNENFDSLEKAIAASSKQRGKEFYKALFEHVEKHKDYACYKEYIELPDSGAKEIEALTRSIYESAVKEKDEQLFDIGLKTVTNVNLYIEMNLRFAREIGGKDAIQYYRNILSVDEGNFEAQWNVFVSEAGNDLFAYCANENNRSAIEEELFSCGFNPLACDCLAKLGTENFGKEGADGILDFALTMIPKSENELYASILRGIVDRLLRAKKPAAAKKYNEMLLSNDSYDDAAYFNRCLIKRGFSNPLELMIVSGELLEDEDFMSAVNCYTEKFPGRKNLYLDIRDAYDKLKESKIIRKGYRYAAKNVDIEREKIPSCKEKLEEAIKKKKISDRNKFGKWLIISSVAGIALYLLFTIIGWAGVGSVYGFFVTAFGGISALTFVLPAILLIIPFVAELICYGIYKYEYRDREEKWDTLYKEKGVVLRKIPKFKIWSCILAVICLIFSVVVSFCGIVRFSLAKAEKNGYYIGDGYALKLSQKLENYSSFVNFNGYAVIQCNNGKNLVVIPESYNGKPVTTIAKDDRNVYDAFSKKGDRYKYLQIKIPKSITTFHGNPFSGSYIQIEYEGTLEEWNAIKGVSVLSYADGYIVNCTDGSKKYQ